jgi:uncharacterized protein YraI
MLLSLVATSLLAAPQDPVTASELAAAIKPFAEAGLVYNDCGYVSPRTGRVVLAGTVTANALNIRAGARADADKVGTAKQGAMIYVYALEGDWVEVVTGDLRGWAASHYVECKQTFHPKYKGKDRKDIGLACSSFATAVLARVRGQAFHGSLHTKYGDQIAAHHELKAETTVSVASIVESRQLNVPDGVYFFDARRETAGHVGFLVVAAKAVEKQYHFSTTTDGLCDPAGFWSWLKDSKYAGKGGTLTLYQLTKKK